MIRTLPTICVLLLATSAYAYRGRPVADLRFDQHRSTQQAAIASDGTSFVVLTSAFWSQLDFVFSQKVADAQPVGPHRQIGDGEVVNLIWTGSRYLAGRVDRGGLWTATLSREGSPLITSTAPAVEGDAVFLAASTSSALAFAYTGTQLAVRPLDVEGRPTAGAIVHTAPAAGANVTVAAAAGGFAAVFSGAQGTWLMLFRADGTAITSSPTLLDASSNVARIATDGTRTLVIFGAGQSPVAAELRSAIVDASGIVESKKVIYTIANGDANMIQPAGLVWDGSRYVAALSIQRARLTPDEVDPALLRVDASGERTGDVVWLSEKKGRQTATSLGWNGREMLASLYDPTSFTAASSVSVNPSTMQPSEPALLGRTLTYQNGPRVATGQGGYLAVWSDREPDLSTVRASRVDADGNALDGEGIVVDAWTGPRNPAIAIDGSGPAWLVVTTDAQTIRGTFVSRGGVRTSVPFTIGQGWEAAVLWDGAQYIVVFTDGSLRMTTVSPSGTVGDVRTLVAEETIQRGDVTEGTYYSEPHLVLLQNRPVAFFLREHGTCSDEDGCAVGYAAMGLRLDRDDAQPFVVLAPAATALAAAASSTHALVAADLPQGVGAVLLSADALEQGGVPFVLDANGVQPSVAFDGTDFITAWVTRTPDVRIAAARVTTTRTITGTVMRADRSEESAEPSVAASAALRPLIGFSQIHWGYDSVLRAAMLFESELDDQGLPPAAPANVCAFSNDDGTTTVSWKAPHNTLGISIELGLDDGTFRQIAVAPAGATSARVTSPGLEGDSFRVRAWNAGGLSAPSSIAQTDAAPAATLRSSMRACAGSPATISITLEGLPPFTIRWADGHVQSKLTSFSATRTVNVTSNTTFTIVSVADASCGVNEVPESIRVTIDPQPAIDDQTRQVKVTPGQTATLSVVASDATQFAWFEGAPGDVSRPAGANSAAFTTPPLTQSTRYWVRVSNRCGSIDSAVMKVTVNAKRRAARS